MNRFTCEAVNHLDTERRKAASVVGLSREEARGRLYERVERFFRREVCLIAGHRRPEQCRAIDGVVPGHTAHCGKLTADIVLDAPQFLCVIAPCHHIEVGPD